MEALRVVRNTHGQALGTTTQLYPPGDASGLSRSAGGSRGLLSLPSGAPPAGWRTRWRLGLSRSPTPRGGTSPASIVAARRRGDRRGWSSRPFGGLALPASRLPRFPPPGARTRSRRHVAQRHVAPGTLPLGSALHPGPDEGE